MFREYDPVTEAFSEEKKLLTCLALDIWSWTDLLRRNISLSTLVNAGQLKDASDGRTL